MNGNESVGNEKLGRDLLFDMLKEYEVPYIFGNPGTSELPFIDGAEHHEDIEYISALHEANAVSMAMGYARQSQKPGVVILHVAPGLANGMGNIYNAYRAGIPLVVIAGQHHTDLLLGEPILAGQHVKQVESMTKWAHEISNMSEFPVAMQRAFKVAMTEPRGPVFLSIPYNLSLSPVATTIRKPELFELASSASEQAVEQFVSKLLDCERILIVSGDQVGEQQAIVSLQNWAELLGAPIVVEGMPTRQNIDSNHEQYIGTLPMNAKIIRQTYAQYDAIVMVGTTVQLPVALSDGKGHLIEDEKPVFYLQQDAWEIAKNQGYAYALQGSVLNLLQQVTKQTERQLLANNDTAKVNERKANTVAIATKRREELAAQLAEASKQDVISAIVLADELNRQLSSIENGAFTVVNEAVSNAMPFVNYTHMWEPSHYTAGKGGGLGHATGQALGIKLANPERTVVCVVGDGTFLYYPQVLYSAVTYHIPVLFIIVQNQSYHVLKQGLKAMGEPLGHAEIASLDLKNAAQMLQLVRSFGVEGESVTAPDQLAEALQRALKLSQQKPYVLEVNVI